MSCLVLLWRTISIHFQKHIDIEWYWTHLIESYYCFDPKRKPSFQNFNKLHGVILWEWIKTLTACWQAQCVFFSAHHLSFSAWRLGFVAGQFPDMVPRSVVLYSVNMCFFLACIHFYAHTATISMNYPISTHVYSISYSWQGAKNPPCFDSLWNIFSTYWYITILAIVWL